jgi:hypothetical protein
MALLDRFVSDLLGSIVSAIAGAEPHEDRLKSGVEALIAFVEERPGAWRLLSRNVSDPVVAETLERLREQTAETIAAIMIEDASEPQEGDLPVEQTAAVFAHLLSGGIQFLIGWWIDNPGSLTREQLVDQVMNFAWIGLERLTAGERWRA